MLAAVDFYRFPWAIHITTPALGPASKPSHPNEARCDNNHGKGGSSKLFIPCGNAPELFYLTEEALYEMPLLIKVFVVLLFYESILLGRNYRHSSLFLNDVTY